MTLPTRPLPKELKRLHEWLDERKPYSDMTLEETLVAETSVYVNPARALTLAGFQDAVTMLADAIRQGKVGISRPRHEKAAEPVVDDTPVRWPVAPNVD